MVEQKSLVLGVDGGGSKTRVWLASADSLTSPTAAPSPPSLVVLAKALGGPTNLRAMGFDAALKNLLIAIQDVFSAAAMKPVKVAGACFSLAGAGREEEQLAVRRWVLQREIAERVQVVGDAEVVLAAAADPESWSSSASGLSLIAGTGSLAWGHTAQGTTARAGGWGYLVGDEGSGFDLGRRVLQQVCRTADGREEHELLKQRLLQHLKLQKADELISWCYGAEHPRQRIASLAPFVFSVAHDDQAALQIVNACAHELALKVAAVARKLSFKPEDYLLACAGSLLVNQPEYLSKTLSWLTHFGWPPKVHRLVPEPVLGALRLAAWPARR